MACPVGLPSPAHTRDAGVWARSAAHGMTRRLTDVPRRMKESPAVWRGRVAGLSAAICLCRIASGATDRRNPHNVSPAPIFHA